MNAVFWINIALRCHPFRALEDLAVSGHRALPYVEV